MGQWLTLAHGDDASWRDLSAGGRRARLLSRWNRRRLVVFVHGGGWQFGSIDASHGVCAFLSKTTGLKVLSLDYRLAWQAQFPAAFDDVVAGFRRRSIAPTSSASRATGSRSPATAPAETSLRLPRWRSVPTRPTGPSSLR